MFDYKLWGKTENIEFVCLLLLSLAATRNREIASLLIDLEKDKSLYVIS